MATTVRTRRPPRRRPRRRPVRRYRSASMDPRWLLAAVGLVVLLLASGKAAALETAAAPAPAATAPANGNVRMIIGRVTSGFGARWGTSHQGLDIAAPIGTPIRAPLDGIVISSGPAQGFGLWVRLRHADGTVTVYGHINRSLVKVGQQVKAGQVIAEVGNRGQSTGPHLHYGVMVGGAYINPRPWLDQRGIRYR